MNPPKDKKSPNSFSIDQIQDPLAFRLAQEFLPQVPKQHESEPSTPRLNMEDCTVCPYAEQMKRIELDTKGNESLFLGPVEKADVQCLILIDKFKPKKVADKWIVPSKKLMKCVLTAKGEDGLYGWENPKLFRECEVLNPPKPTTGMTSMSGKIITVKHEVGPYGIGGIPDMEGEVMPMPGFASPRYLARNPSFKAYLDEQAKKKKDEEVEKIE